VYDIKDHDDMYAKFRIGNVIVRVESAQVRHVALLSKSAVVIV